jgi:hypothetical protein
MFRNFPESESVNDQELYLEAVIIQAGWEVDENDEDRHNKCNQECFKYINRFLASEGLLVEGLFPSEEAKVRYGIVCAEWYDLYAQI